MNNLIKISIVVLFFSNFSFTSLLAQNDVMYIMKDGAVVGEYNVNTEIDSIIFYKPTTDSTFTDIRDGNIYQIVQIGNQVWMAENLKYLPSVVGPGTGSNEQAYYYVYNYDGTDVTAAKASYYYQTYGVLYNWTASLNACPTGWHLPSDSEWTELTDYLGGNSVAGGKLKETGTTHWNSPNAGATNETGFSALPGGRRLSDGSFLNLGDIGIWRSSTENDIDDAWSRYLYSAYEHVYRSNIIKELGFSVRCVKD